MIDKIPPDEIIATVRSAAHEVFSTMLNLPLEDRDGFQQPEADPPGTLDGVEALVGVAGSWTGTGRICCSSHFACRLAGALLMAEYTALDEDVLDAVAEVANMTIGNVKTHFEEKLGPLGLSIPTVIFGRNYQTRSMGVPAWVVVPFASGDDRWEIRFCLMPTRSHAAHPASPRADALQPA
jgi:chemotaxis protein CheX